MTPAPLVQAASQNLIDTYVHLGRAVPGSRVAEEDAFLSCQGPFDHTICNFATRLRLDPWSARRLHDLAAERAAFSVYRLPGDAPEHVEELLVRAGFRIAYRLVQMVNERPDPGPGIEMRSSTTVELRESIARFMSHQFFSRQSEAFRRRVAGATAAASGLELCDLEERRQRIAAVMLCHTPEILGVYNLCVVSSRRGRGIGGGVLDWVLTLARETGRAATLQCDPRLEGWYGYRGFVSTGRVDVYSLPKRKDDDIIL